jgi:hypothetical protein
VLSCKDISVLNKELNLEAWALTLAVQGLPVGQLRVLRASVINLKRKRVNWFISRVLSALNSWWQLKILCKYFFYFIF